MQKIKLFWAGFLISAALTAQPVSQNFTLLSNWDNDSLPNYVHGAYNEVWGYSDPSGNEYAILGTIVGTYFINVTHPSSPQQISFFPGRDTLGINRDFKTYGHYAYGVCDQGKGSLQIFDLSNLPTSVVKVYDDTNLVKTCHTLFIEKERIYFCGAVDSNGVPKTLIIASLENPENPTLLATFSSPLFEYVHACFVQNDTVFLSCGNDGMYVYDARDPLNFQLIQYFSSYPQKGYNHSSWVSKDGKTLVFTDETHGSGIKVFDLSSFDNPVLSSLVRSNLLEDQDSLGPSGSIAHNPYLVGDLLFCSYYHDGLQVFDLSNPDQPMKKGYYDTEIFHPDYTGVKGAWGVYPFLPSKNILVSDINHGLFVLDGTGIFSGMQPETFPHLSGRITFQNPALEKIYLRIQPENATLSWVVIDLPGNIVFSGINAPFQESLEITPPLSAGIYFLKTMEKGNFQVEKILVIR